MDKYIAETIDYYAHRVMSEFEKLWFYVLFRSIKTYLHGLDEKFEEQDSLEHSDVERWIFKTSGLSHGFDEVWSMFFDIDPKVAKLKLLERYRSRTRNRGTRRNHAKDKSHHGRGGGAENRRDVVDQRDHIRDRVGEDWIERLFFG